jgi:TRAP-type C4-dicarboxylate transport system permease small subunit
MGAWITRLVKATSGVMHVISVVAICGMVLMTCFDVVMRRVGYGVAFPFEIVCALAGIVMAFGLPQTTLSGTHVAVDFLKDKASPHTFRLAYVCTRCLGIVLLLILSWGAARFGNQFLESHQQSAVLHIPEFIFPYLLAAGGLVTCIVLFHRAFSRTNERQS